MTRYPTIILALTALAAVTFAPAAALAQAAPPAARPAPAPPPGYEAAQRWFEALPEADRKAIQDALTWTGDFSAVTSGQFGMRTFSAVLAWQKRAKARPDGVLDDAARAALIAQGAAAKAAVGFSAVADAPTGARIGLPTKLLDSKTPRGTGVRYASADGKVTLDTAAPKPGEIDLPRLFEALTAPDPKRKITYKFQRPDFFVVTGEIDGRKYYQRFVSGPDGAIRGYTFAYPAAMAARLDRLTVAIANAYDPFPGTGVATPAAIAASGPALAGPAAPSSLIATALVVAPGRAITGEIPAQCALSAAGAAAKVLSTADGLSLIELGAQVGRPAPGFAISDEQGSAQGSAKANAQGDAIVLSFVAEAGRMTLDVAGATVIRSAGGALRVIAPLAGGGAGAPVFDRAGGLIGVVGSSRRDPIVVAGVTPLASHALIPAAAVARMRENAAPAPAVAAGSEAISSGAIAARLAPSLIALECRR